MRKLITGLATAVVGVALTGFMAFSTPARGAHSAACQEFCYKLSRKVDTQCRINKANMRGRSRGGPPGYGVGGCNGMAQKAQGQCLAEQGSHGC
jgi:hypothetical protein